MLELPYFAHTSCGGLFSDKVSLLLNCTWGLCPVSLLWWVLMCWYLWEVSLMYSEVVCLYDGKLDVFYSVWDDEPISLCCFWFNSLDDSRQFLCILGLRGLWVPANLFLLYNWVITLGFWEVLLGLLDLAGSGGVLKFTLVCVTRPLHFILILFWGGCNKLWFGILVIQAINHFGHLKFGLKVLLCFVYCFAMSTLNFIILVRLGIVAIDLWFLNSRGLWGVLRLCYIWDLLFGYLYFLSWPQWLVLGVFAGLEK